MQTECLGTWKTEVTTRFRLMARKWRRPSGSKNFMVSHSRRAECKKQWLAPKWWHTQTPTLRSETGINTEKNWRRFRYVSKLTMAVENPVNQILGLYYANCKKCLLIRVKMSLWHSQAFYFLSVKVRTLVWAGRGKGGLWLESFQSMNALRIFGKVCRRLADQSAIMSSIKAFYCYKGINLL